MNSDKTWLTKGAQENCEVLRPPAHPPFKFYSAVLKSIKNNSERLTGDDQCTARFSCTHPSCGKSFHRLSRLKRHIKTHSNERPYKCTHCNKAYGRMEHLTTHSLTHAATLYEKKPFFCTASGCGTHFTTSFHLRRHVFKHLRKVWSDIKLKKVPSPTLTSKSPELPQKIQEYMYKCPVNLSNDLTTSLNDSLSMNNINDVNDLTSMNNMNDLTSNNMNDLTSMNNMNDITTINNMNDITSMNNITINNLKECQDIGQDIGQDIVINGIPPIINPPSEYGVYYVADPQNAPLQKYIEYDKYYLDYQKEPIIVQQGYLNAYSKPDPQCVYLNQAPNYPYYPNQAHHVNCPQYYAQEPVFQKETLNTQNACYYPNPELQPL